MAARAGRRSAASLDDSFDDGGALDEKIASYVRKPVDEIVEDTMEQWRRRKDLRRFEGQRRMPCPCPKLVLTAPGTERSVTV